MLMQTKNGTIICTDCNIKAKSIREYEEDQHAGEADYYWVPFDYDDESMYICPHCHKRGFISYAD